MLKVKPSFWHLVAIFALTKLLIHFFTNANYELHRDAYLYYAMSEHISLGYHAVPPFIALIGKLSTLIFGNTAFGLRFFPALVGAANLYIIALVIKELKGGKVALSLASLAFILSPTFLHVNTLFQPVAFNQFFWLLACYVILLLIKYNNPKYWIWLALVFALAFYNKYSVAFLALSFAIALLLSKHRKLYLSKQFFMAIAIGTILILPNIIWQYNNNWPVLMHMKELKETQLVHVQLSSFFTAQLLMHIQAIFLWIPALLILLFNKKEKQYRIFAFMLILVVALIALGSGKSYYTMGIFPILFVFGAYFIEKYTTKRIVLASSFIVIHIAISLIVSFKFDGIPLRTAEQTYSENSFTWEDGKKYAIPQDMADMTGWKELGVSVAHIFDNLSDADKKDCAIFCHNYGQAGSIMFYGKKHGVPQPACFNDSFIFWSPNEIKNKNVIIVIHERESYEESEYDINRFFNTWKLKHTINNEYFRENGTRIYLASNPEKGFSKYYADIMKEVKGKYK